MHFYYESIGECVNQVYEIKAKSWEAAKRAIFKDMAVGDCIAMCEPSTIKKYDEWPDYHYNKDMCENFAQLKKGCWSNYVNSDVEYWENRVYMFSDEPEIYLDGEGKVFDNWRTMIKEV